MEIGILNKNKITTNKNKTVRIYHIKSGIRCLGPGNRFVIYFQGCKRGCKGCIAPNSHDIESGKLYYITDILKMIEKEKNKIEGITFSGGEPFLQTLQLAKIIKEIKNINNKLSIMIFTGYTLEELKIKNSRLINYILDNTDILVDGHFDLNAIEEGDPWRGSKNQRIHFLTNRYSQKDHEIATKFGIEVSLDDDGFFIYGIPPKGFTAYFENFLYTKSIF